MQPVVTGAQMREIDRITIEDAGVSGMVLMESAGRGVAEVVRDVYEELGAEGPIVVVCGKGNNGGDGFVVARYLSGWGAEVLCLLCAPREEVTGDALEQLDIVDTLGVEVMECTDGLSDEAAELLSLAAVVVDALLGTGLTGDVRAPADEFIAAINECDVPVIAVDLPSGIHSDTGAVLGSAVIADATVTFAFHKRGLFGPPGCDYAGEVSVVDIGIPWEVAEHVSPNAFTDADLAPPWLPPRLSTSHKGSYGHVLIVGGSKGKSGAPALAGLAALKAGAGLVTLHVPEPCRQALEGRYLELMFSTGPVQAALAGKSAVVIGPGLVPDEEGQRLLEAALASGVPVVADAGAVELLAAPETQGVRTELPPPLVVTPHPGEAGRLLGTTSKAIQADRWGAAAALAESTGAIVALKGNNTLIAANEAMFVNTTGNAGMATAGSGDVLVGIIGAFLHRMEPVDAVRTAVHLHGIAGDLVARHIGQESLTATDLIAALPSVLHPTDD